MQRNLAYKTNLAKFWLLLLFLVFENLNSINYAVPPLFGLSFILFYYAAQNERYDMFIPLSIYLVLFEADKGFILFSSIVFFLLIYKFVIYRIRIVIHCEYCLEIIYIALAYVGYWVFSLILHQIFWLDFIVFDWHIVYYIIIESLLVWFL